MEICGVNRFYGHANIIKSYCGYPYDEPIPLVIQNGHGLGLLHDHFEEPIFDYWVYSEDIKKKAIEYHVVSPDGKEYSSGVTTFFTAAIF